MSTPSFPTIPALPEALPEVLDPLRFPLHGSRLIEASAGTGKTFTIAALYVRLVLGHGQAQAYARALTPPEILVVTFTDAATQELRDRIRRRLAEAAVCFYADPAGITARPAGEDLLHDLRAEYPPEQWTGCARKLQLAAEWMDEAAVSTIHGWCNRMLREHAFDSDSLFTQTLKTDQSELLSEVVRDYWRTFMAPLDAPSVAEVLPWWPGPAVLQSNLRNLVEHAGLLAATGEPAVALLAARAEKQLRLAKLKAPWASWVEELKELLNDAVAGNCVNRQRLQARFYLPWLEALRAWAVDPQALQPELTDTGWTRLTPAGLKEVWIKGDPPEHPALDAILVLQAALKALPTARNDLLRHAACWVAERFDAEQARHAQMGFNDLLTGLDDALHGPNGLRLAEIIRRQFPVALIDEFQDTDPVQYRIFDAVYHVAQNDPETALILIGDPKQAIYAFRGADIHTYLAARLASVGRLYTLKKNFRSTHAMVTATNRCFEAAETRTLGAGAFLFRSESGNPVPFVTADAQGRKDMLQAEGVQLPALTAWWLLPENEAKPISKTDYLDLMSEACASEMVRLLNLGQAGKAGFGAETLLKLLRPADMAVLVNNRTEAVAIRKSLAARGVRSVYLSDKDSVFASAQAAELQHWLAACAEPDDARLLRAALATATLNLSYPELDTLNHDELAWEARVLQFRSYRECWRRQGVLPMLRRLLNDFQVPARLLGDSGRRTGDSPQNGERILTDVLHLAELLQQASLLLDGEHALIRYLAEQLREAGQGAGGDARQIRLESDADLVQVVTVHKSKGLEYPLVFLPFACGYRRTKTNDLPLKYHDEEGRLQIALSDEDGVLELADRERLGEDMRKLYVALTRARYATWVGIAPLASLERSAFGYLLRGGEALAAGALAALLNDLRGSCEHIVVAPAPEATNERFKTRGPTTVSGKARQTQRAVREHWWIASYSTLKTVGADSLTVPDTPAEDVFRETRAALAALPAPTTLPATPQAIGPAAAAPFPGSLHGLPRGAEVGSFLHNLLESVATQGFAKVAARPVRLGDMIARRCNLRGWDHWIEPLTAWLQDFLITPLQLPAMDGVPAASFSLAGLASSMAEMEFWLATHTVDIEQIDRLIRAHTLAGAPRPALEPGQLNGMLKGFIDLVFEHDGRYYVADYKSNWLGPDDAAYTPEALCEAILYARYDLQYVLYIFALHRLLKARLPDYDYDRHVGGAVYVFLRGLHAPGQGLHTDRPPRALIEALDELFVQKSAKEIA
ncbi:exodeoxyribonuclease V subunit beta [Propionivibrio sp.]|uniref:exodeoxyribonuclease V subunit beta n=1 Tax=Propionivibrio sp. TaxID=2212460 RepID=UPI003BF1BCFB